MSASPGPYADILRTFCELFAYCLSTPDFVGSKREMSPKTGPAKLLGQVRRLELHKNEEMINRTQQLRVDKSA